MIHNLSKIFLNYGDSNWTIGILIGTLVAIIGAALLIICMKTEYWEGILDISGKIAIVVGFVIILISIESCIRDEQQNVQTAIKREYEDACFINEDNKFIIDNKVYNYEITDDRKIIVYLLGDIENVKNIE